MRQKTGIALLLGLAWSKSVCAGCWVEAGDRHSIEPVLLYAIAQVESGLDPGAVNHNANGSRDIGVMQINSLHFPRLKARGITEQRLRDDPCLSVEVGASILAEFVQRYGYNWTAVGAYNAGSSDDRQALRLHYAGKVWRRYQALLADDSVSAKL
ncbi:transglycosylase SLT domain-containing protein [Pseudomonas carnis]|nr:MULTISPECIES: transglycosylase SLT domain-containing protein [Pseudomonas]MBY8955631.1 transglycosylase SLT domain-containing protein [Pseudomonas carnis]